MKLNQVVILFALACWQLKMNGQSYFKGRITYKMEERSVSNKYPKKTGTAKIVFGDGQYLITSEEGDKKETTLLDFKQAKYYRITDESKLLEPKDIKATEFSFSYSPLKTDNLKILNRTTNKFSCKFEQDGIATIWAMKDKKMNDIPNPNNTNHVFQFDGNIALKVLGSKNKNKTTITIIATKVEEFDTDSIFNSYKKTDKIVYAGPINFRDAPNDLPAQAMPAPPAEDPLKVYSKTEIEPRYNGDWDVYINKENAFTKKTNAAKLVCTATVAFIIKKDSTVYNVKIESISNKVSKYEAEALRLIKKTSGQWRPAIQNGVDVNAIHNITINFYE